MGGGGGGRLFEAGRLLTFSAIRMGAYSRWALIRGWALIRINTVNCIGPQLEKSTSCASCSTLSSVSVEMANSSTYQDIPNLSDISRRRGLKFLHLNVCSLLPKLDEIRLLLQRYKNINCFPSPKLIYRHKYLLMKLAYQAIPSTVWIDKLTRGEALLLNLYSRLFVGI